MRSSVWCAGFACLAGCQYDIDSLYRFASSDAAADVPGPSIDLYASVPFVDEDCKACANKSCAKACETICPAVEAGAEKKCKVDPACVALAQCAAQGVEPDQLSECRAEQADWCAQDVVGRGLGGPFYTCVFRDKCSEKCGTPSDWSCLDTPYTWETTAADSVPVRIRFAEALDGIPASGLTVKVYRRVDDSLANPAGVYTTNKEGVAALTLPTPLRSFRGYLQIEGDGWYPTLIQFGYPIARESVIAMPIVTQLNVERSTAAAGATPEPELGLLQIRMFGCAGVLMRDVSFAADLADQPNSVTWYYDGQTANTEIDKTTTYGNGGIVNVRAGTAVVTGKWGNRLVAKTFAPVRPGFLTIVLLAPLDSSQI